MAQGFRIADGYIDVHAELDRGELQRTIQAGVASISRAARTVNLFGDWDRGDIARGLAVALGSIPQRLRTVQLGGDFDASALGATLFAALRTIPARLRTVELLVDLDTAELGRKLTAAIRRIPDRLRTITLNVDVDMGAALVSLVALRALLSGIGGAGGGLGDLNRTVTTLGSSLASLANPVGLVVSLISAAIAPTATLLGTLTLLAPIVYTVVGAFGAATTVMVGMVGVGATLALGLRGVTGAIKSMVTEGKVANDVLKSLSPSARAFVLALSPVKGLLDSIGKQLQERLFAGLAKEMTNLIDRMGPLIPFLGLIADGLNSIGQRIIRSFADTRNVERMASIFDGMSRFLVRIGDVIPTIVRSLLTIGEAALPVVEMLGNGIAKVADRFAQWLEDADKSGALQNFFVEAAAAMKDIVHIGGLVFTILGQIGGILFGKSKETSGTVFSGVLSGLQSISDWLDKPENQEKIKGFVDGLVRAFDWLLKEGIPAIKRFIDTVDKEWVPTIRGWINTVQGWIETARVWGARISQLKDDIIDFPGKVLGALSTFGTSVSTAISEGFDTAKTNVGNTFNTIVEEVKKLPERIGGALLALPETVGNLFTTAFDRATHAIGFAAGTLVLLTVGLVIGIGQALLALPETVSNAFNTAKDTAITTAESAWNTVVDTATTLPGRVGTAVSGLWGSISGAFFTAKDEATGQASLTVDTVVETLRGLPGRAASALSGFAGSVSRELSTAVGSAFRIGSDIMSGVADGIRSGVGWVVDVVKRAAGNIVQGFKDALQMRSPSRLLADDVGIYIPQGIEVGILRGLPALRRTIEGLVPELVPGQPPPALRAAVPVLAAARSAAHVAASTVTNSNNRSVHVTFQVDASELRTRQALERFMRDAEVSARALVAGAR